MAVAIDSAVGSGGSGNEPSPFTASFSNNAGTYMLGMFSTTSAVTGVSISYNGVVMTPIQGEAGASPFQYIFALANPATGSNNFSASWSGGSAGNALLMMMTFTGVGSLGTVDHSTFSSATTPFSTTVTLGANDMLAAFGAYNNGTVGNLAVSVGTERVEVDGGSAVASEATNTGTGSVSVTWTRAVSAVATAVGVPLLAISGPIGVKTVNGLAAASVKTMNGLTYLSVKTINGLA